MSRPLLQKLGWKPGTPALLWRVPEELASALAQVASAQADQPAFRMAFVRSAAELSDAATEVAAAYSPGGHLWLCYPKKSGRIRSDVTRDHGWDPVHALGLLAVTQVALDEDWSALRFRHRSEISKLTRRDPAAAAFSPEGAR